MSKKKDSLCFYSTPVKTLYVIALNFNQQVDRPLLLEVNN